MAADNGQRQIILCFDGTGNTFQSNGTETNILKICRMLERTDDQLIYYQPGIGTEVTPGSLASHSLRAGSRGGNTKALNLALGKSFDRHVLGGYRFLMRHYKVGTRIFIFGFSRGAYTAWFLNALLDHAGLLGADNEEVIPFVWDAYAAFMLAQSRGGDEVQQKRGQAYNVLKTCRETLCRPMGRVQFLGLFDTVNSVTDFEVQYDSPPSAKTIRHAVSIDERRVKFRPTLLEVKRRASSEAGSKIRPTTFMASQSSAKHRRPGDGAGNDATNRQEGCMNPKPQYDERDVTKNKEDESEDDFTDIEEVWFTGSHSDVGGGCEFVLGEKQETRLSNIPLVWMVEEARRAGIRFDEGKIEGAGISHRTSPEAVEGMLLSAAEKGIVHDSMQSLLWRLVERLPVKRRELMADHSYKFVRFPPSRGSMRGVPRDMCIHDSVIQRMKADSSYRPANLKGCDAVREFFSGNQ